MLFRDPDGNLINIFAPIDDQAGALSNPNPSGESLGLI
jgi:hypothetical protein